VIFVTGRIDTDGHEEEVSGDVHFQLRHRGWNAEAKPHWDFGWIIMIAKESSGLLIRNDITTLTPRLIPFLASHRSSYIVDGTLEALDDNCD
jgi:hypothetical protein